ncbi:hypothetical protein Pyn_12539 [Prunus yedoensis var. nudiflora]|uniref:Uncharacterized protein n=1 Tax=Prunus yedoensis var. nudiflora TaxID=2094558 RepID=A0A314Y4P4_PRUYE|nr:hypothetical protein Pyn_12539 [Prunus yedoensis var. nudiflora]
MEAKQVRCAVLVCLVLGLVLGQSTAQLFQLCYGACFGICIVKEHNPLKCGIRCLKNASYLLNLWTATKQILLISASLVVPPLCALISAPKIIQMKKR